MRSTCFVTVVQVVFVGLIFGLIAKVLWLLKTLTFGALNLEGFWFPAPFYQFWEAKLFIKNLQIDGCKIRTKATQDDAYMRFCTEAMLNFWTLGQRRHTHEPPPLLFRPLRDVPSACHAGFYKRCCSKKASFERWLDRSLVWVGKAPRGFNNQFRIFDKKLTLIQKASLAPHARGPRSVTVHAAVDHVWPSAVADQAIRGRRGPVRAGWLPQVTSPPIRIGRRAPSLAMTLPVLGQVRADCRRVLAGRPAP